MNNEKGRAFLLCMIGLFVMIILGWKHTETLSADDYVKETIGVVEISIVTPVPKYQQTDKEEYINFDLRNLAIVKKDNEDETAGSEGLQPNSAGSQPDDEQYVENGAGSAIDTQDPTGYEEDAEGTEGIGYSEGDTGLCDTDAWDSVGRGSDGDTLSELVESAYEDGQRSNDPGSEGWVDESGDAEIGYSDGYSDVSEVEEPEWLYYEYCRITHYCPCASCCGEYATGYTANGSLATPNHTVATGEDLPFGTEVLINGQVYIVEDRGVGYGEIDVFVSDHQTALNMGQYYTDVYVRYPE